MPVLIAMLKRLKVLFQLTRMDGFDLARMKEKRRMMNPSGAIFSKSGLLKVRCSIEANSFGIRRLAQLERVPQVVTESRHVRSNYPMG
jgi:hypothetical protein